MDKIELKRKIKSFTINCAMATGMFAFASNYAMIIRSGGVQFGY